jgi:hypothetical protein
MSLTMTVVVYERASATEGMVYNSFDLASISRRGFQAVISRGVENFERWLELAARKTKRT